MQDVNNRGKFGGRDIWELSALPAQLFYKPKTLLKMKSINFKIHGSDKICIILEVKR